MIVESITPQMRSPNKDTMQKRPTKRGDTICLPRPEFVHKITGLSTKEIIDGMQTNIYELKCTPLP